MKDWLFISDFDGTLTHKDFYKIVIEKFQPQLGRELERQWRSGEITVYEFLQRVFASLDRSEQEIFEAILMIPIDRDAKEFIQRVKTAGGDFLILSAGTAYYIERLLKHLGIEGVSSPPWRLPTADSDASGANQPLLFEVYGSIKDGCSPIKPVTAGSFCRGQRA